MLIPGQTETGFQVYNFALGNYEYRPGKLVAQGKFCNVYIERGKENLYGAGSAEIFAQIVKNFDEKVFPSVCRWFGKPQIPAGFNLADERVFIFLVDIYDRFSEGYVAGYFDHRDIEGLFGNQKPVFFMDIDPNEPGDPDDKSNPFYRTLAHEFQHMVNYSIQLANGQPEQERWLDEGFSMFSEYVFSGETGRDDARIPPSPHFERFLENPRVNLISNSRESWFMEDSLFRQYGASFMFVAYLVEKYGGETPSMAQQFTRELVRTGPKGCAGLNLLLNSVGTSFNEVFINFSLALMVDDVRSGNGLWGFNDKIRSFGRAAEILPLKISRYYAASGEDSFIGSENRTIGNSINVEEINGAGAIQLNLACEPGMTPYVAEISRTDSGTIRPVPLDSEGKARIALDFNNLRRFFILPVALDDSFVESRQFNYSFKSAVNSYVMYPLPNPAFPEQFLIFLRSFAGAVEPVPQLQINFGNLVDRPVFEAVDASNTLFVAHYRLPGDGRGQAICNIGTDMCAFSFSAVRLRANTPQTILHGEASLLVTADESGSMAMIAGPDSGAQVVPPGAVSGPFDVFLGQDASATFVLPAEEGRMLRTGLCRTDQDGRLLTWHPLHVSEGTVAAKIDGSGRYFLVADHQPPTFSAIQLRGNRSQQPVLFVDAADAQSGPAAETLQVMIDDVSIAAPVSGGFPCEIKLDAVEEGDHQISLSLRDHAGNRTSASLRAQLITPVRILQTVAYPNPCRNRVRISMSFAGAPVFSDAVVKIFDAAGHRVAGLQMAAGAGKTLWADWNLEKSDGKAVSNGVYFYRASATVENTKFKAQGKIAVLR